MVKDNYAAWQINADDFSHEWPDSKKLQFFARYAILAPSGHNTQPWKLIAQENSILVEINQSHYLSIDGSGLLSVEPYISIGTFLEVFSLAARGFGYELAVHLFPHEDQVAEISIKKTTAPKPSLLDAVTSRVSNRNPFETDAISQDALQKISTNSLSGVEATLVTDRTDIDFLANQTETAIASIMSNSLYRKELSAWVRTNQTHSYDGMPGFTHGFGNFKSLLSYVAVRHLPNHGPQAKKSGELIRRSGALVIVRCTNNQRESFVNAGRLYSQICVFANDLDFASSALGASVLDPNTREQVKQRFKIQDRPIYVIRLGKAIDTSEHSPRWPLEKVLSR